MLAKLTSLLLTLLGVLLFGLLLWWLQPKMIFILTPSVTSAAYYLLFQCLSATGSSGRQVGQPADQVDPGQASEASKIR